jgi:nucleotide-binding universal stress UspA family protein
MYDGILVPTDGSEVARHAIEHALGIAETYGGHVHAVYVVDVTAYSSLEAGTDAIIEALRAEGQRAVDDVVEAATERGIDAEGHVLSGTAHRSLLSFVEERSVDLVVMATHGRRGVERYLLGSVTERLVRSSPVPVLTIRRPDAADDA